MDRPKANYLLGFTMSSRTHDYSKAHKALEMLKARQVSPRVWVCSVTQAQRSYLFAMFKFCLAWEDQLIIEEAPDVLALTTADMAASDKTSAA